jgi:hypothetical protein
MSSPATLLLWFQLRSPELAEDFERLMAGDRDIVRGSLDTVSDWRLTRPADVPGQALDRAAHGGRLGASRLEPEVHRRASRPLSTSAEN